MSDDQEPFDADRMAKRDLNRILAKPGVALSPFVPGEPGPPATRQEKPPKAPTPGVVRNDKQVLDHPTLCPIARQHVLEIVAVLSDLSDVQRSTIERAVAMAVQDGFALGKPTIRFEDIIPRPTVRLPSYESVSSFTFTAGNAQHRDDMESSAKADGRTYFQSPWYTSEFYFVDGSWVTHRPLPKSMRKEKDHELFDHHRHRVRHPDRQYQRVIRSPRGLGD